MITIRRSGERVHDGHGAHRSWRTFGGRGRTRPVLGFGALTLFDEECIPPGGAESPLAIEVEVLHYICEGSITFRNGMDDVVLVAGVLLHQAASRHAQRRVRNASAADGARVFRIGLLPSTGARPLGVHWHRVGMEPRRGGLRVVASADGQDASLRVERDVCVSSALLAAGHHVAAELGKGRAVWVHVITGRGRLGVCELAGGDGAGLVDEPLLSFTATEETEVLVIDVPA